MEYLIFVIVLIGLVFNFDKTVIIFAPFKLIVDNFVFVHDLQLGIAISLVALFLFYNRRKQYSDRFPLIIGFVLMLSSVFVNTVYPDLHFSFIAKPLSTMIYCYLLFKVIRNRQNLDLFVKISIVFVFVICLNGFVEFGLGENVLGEWCREHISETSYFSEGTERGGMHRTNSCFAHSIAFGTICAFYVFYLFYLRSKKMINYSVFIITLSVLGISIFISNSRTPLLSLLLLLIPFIKFIIKDRKTIFLVTSLVIVGGGIAYDYFNHMISSMFSNNSDVEGSSMEMRINQLAYCFFLVKDNVMFGLSNRNFDVELHRDVLRGLESVWFWIIIRRGFFGVITYIAMYINCISVALKRDDSIYLVYLSFAWILANTSSNMSGLDDFCYWMFFLVIYKTLPIQNNQVALK